MKIIDRRMKDIKASNIPIMIVLAMVLLGIYGVTLATSLAQAPSVGISRELNLCEFDYEKNKILKSQIITIRRSDDLITTILPDGKETKLLTSNVLGEVVEEINYDFDLSLVSDVVAGYTSDDTVMIYYVKKGLFALKLDLSSNSYEEHVIMDEAKTIDGTTDGMIIETSHGLYAIDFRENHNDEIKIVEVYKGAPLSYKVEAYENQWYLICTHTVDRLLKVEGVVLNKAMERVDSFDFQPSVENEYFKRIVDIYIEEGRMTALFVLTNNRYELNYLSAFQVDLQSQQFLGQFDGHFPILKSKYELVGGELGQAKVLMQQPFNNFINMSLVTIHSEEGSTITPLTKTKAFTQLAGSGSMSGEFGVIFADRKGGEWLLNYVSSHPTIIEATTKASTINFGIILSTIFFTVVVGAIIGGIPFIFIAGVLPFLLSILISKVTGARREGMTIDTRQNISLIIPAVVSCGLKVWMTQYQIHTMSTFNMRPVLIGQEPQIYIVLIILSLISYWLMQRTIKRSKGYGLISNLPFAAYVFTELMLYTMTVFVYLSTVFVIGKL